MRLSFTIFLLVIAYAASYPAVREADSDDDLELELRSIMDQLSDEQDNSEQMTRALNDDDESDDEEASYQMNKRQGGHNIIDKQSKCEITCIHSERNPAKGPGKSVKEAAKACRNICKASTKKRGGKKNSAAKSLKREMMEEREDGSSSEEQQQQRREFLDFLQAQLEAENDK